RFDCDWSSDVCSSDLDQPKARIGSPDIADESKLRHVQASIQCRFNAAMDKGWEQVATAQIPLLPRTFAGEGESPVPSSPWTAHRSEERRVGKEARSRW